MEPPTQRELELETQLRTRDAQVAELVDEVKQLRQYLSTQSAPARTDPVSLPPALLALLQPCISAQFLEGGQTSGASSSTITAGLTQRVRLLQDENDELYELLRTSETGRLKEEVRQLRRVVSKLERALSESHNVVSTLSNELDKAQSAYMSRQPTIHTSRRESRTPPRQSPRPSQTNSANNSLKPIPTGPRAHKKPRLTDSQPSPTSPTRSNASLPPTIAPARGSSSRAARRDRSPRELGDSRRSGAKEPRMDVDEDHKHKRLASPERPREKHRERERDRDRDRERERDRAREKDRERDSERNKERERERSRRNGTAGGRGGGRKGRGPANQDNGDRTLAERMGL